MRISAPLSQRCDSATTTFTLGLHTGHSLLVAMTWSVAVVSQTPVFASQFYIKTSLISYALNDFQLAISLFTSFSLLFRRVICVGQWRQNMYRRLFINCFAHVFSSYSG